MKTDLKNEEKTQSRPFVAHMSLKTVENASTFN